MILVISVKRNLILKILGTFRMVATVTLRSWVKLLVEISVIGYVYEYGVIYPYVRAISGRDDVRLNSSTGEIERKLLKVIHQVRRTVSISVLTSQLTG